MPIGELEAFADTLPEDVLLVMYEAYMEFATKPDCCSMVDYMKAHPEKPILVLRTFSKYYAMAVRLGGKFHVCLIHHQQNVLRKGICECFQLPDRHIRSGRVIRIADHHDFCFSKYYAMAGLRVGYALGSEELIGIMRRTRIGFSGCAFI